MPARARRVMGAPTLDEPGRDEVGDDPEIDPRAQVVATAPEEPDLPAAHRGARGRAAFAVVLVLLAVTGAVGGLGARSRTTSATGGGYHLEVQHPAVTRPGLATTIAIDVQTTDGRPLPEPVVVSVRESYLKALDLNAIEPEPDASAAGGEEVRWEFLPAAGSSRIRVVLDARIEPGVQWGRNARVAVLEDGIPAVEVSFRTWVLP